MDIDKYKVEKITQRGNISIFLVDGEKIRDELDIEFTNFGQHFHFLYIPENEFWLDVESVPNERNFFIDHLLVEWKLMKDGIVYNDAITLADNTELNERKKHKSSKKIIDNKGRLILERIHKELLGNTQDGLSVWIIDGKIIRDNFDIDFTEGGHDLVYDFVPEKEIWLDDDLVEKERSYVLLHELHERSLMNRGFDYCSAHGGSGEIKGASQVEWEARNDKEKLKKDLLRLGWKYEK